MLKQHYVPHLKNSNFIIYNILQNKNQRANKPINKVQESCCAGCGPPYSTRGPKTVKNYIS